MNIKSCIIKPQNYISIIIVALIVIFTIAIVYIFYSIIGSLDLLFDIINLITVSSLVAILSLIQIRKVLYEHYNKDKFRVERIGTLNNNYYYLTIENKTNDLAQNCRACAVFGDEFEYNLVWQDPTYPRAIDITIEEYLMLFYFKDGKLILPECSLNPLFFLKESINNISLKLFQGDKNKDKEIRDKITCWPYENDIYKYEECKDGTYEIYISASNAKTYKISFQSLQTIINKLKEKNPIRYTDSEFKTLLKT